MTLRRGTGVGGCQFRYSFDQIGNRTTAKNFRGGTTKTSVYTPNNLNQYTSRTVPGEVFVTGTAVTNATVSVRLDTNSPASPAQRHGTYFWKALTADNSSAVYSTTNLQSRAYMTSGTNSLVRLETREAVVAKTPEAFSYDLDGNLLTSGLWTNTWSCENRLTQMVSVAAVPDAFKRKLCFDYDAQGRRWRKRAYSDYSGGTYQTTNTHIYVYDGWNCIAEIADGASTNFMTFGLDLSGSLQGAGGVGGLLIIQIGGTNYFPMYNGNGDVMGLVNADDGSVDAEYEYGPFAEVLKANGPVADENRIRYSTKMEDESGALYYGYRYLLGGRWLRRDPLEEAGGNNLYTFLGGDGINSFDLFGLLAGREKRKWDQAISLLENSGFGGAKGTVLGKAIVEQLRRLEKKRERPDADYRLRALQARCPVLRYVMTIEVKENQALGVRFLDLANVFSSSRNAVDITPGVRGTLDQHMGFYETVLDMIAIDRTYLDQHPCKLASVLAHEGTHALQVHKFGMRELTQNLEYEAYTAEELALYLMSGGKHVIRSEAWIRDVRVAGSYSAHPILADKDFSNLPGFDETQQLLGEHYSSPAQVDSRHEQAVGRYKESMVYYNRHRRTNHALTEPTPPTRRAIEEQVWAKQR